MVTKTWVVHFLVMILISYNFWASDTSRTSTNCQQTEVSNLNEVKNFDYNAAAARDYARLSPVGKALASGNPKALQDALQDPQRNLYSEQQFKESAEGCLGLESLFMIIASVFC